MQETSIPPSMKLDGVWAKRIGCSHFHLIRTNENGDCKSLCGQVIEANETEGLDVFGKDVPRTFKCNLCYSIFSWR